MNKRKFFVWTFDDDNGWDKDGPFSSELEAREFVKEHFNKIVELFSGYPEDAVGTEAFIVEPVAHLSIESITVSKTSVNIKENPV